VSACSRRSAGDPDRVRPHPRAAAQRFALLVVALVFGGELHVVDRDAVSEVNAVERVHFVEYGLIAFLFYRAWRGAGDPSIVILPMLAAFTVGTFDEWLQWFIPFRVGEAHDVFINLAAIVCGLLFSLALQPPVAFSWRLRAASWRRIGVTSAIVWIIFAIFVSQVHLGPHGRDRRGWPLQVALHRTGIERSARVIAACDGKRSRR
jgi:VanZ family protein